MMYLPPVFAVILELVFFREVPSALTLAGMAVTCAGVAMAVWKKNKWKSSISSS
jgi:drug/metabolite transporter (DMT)-like permease